MAFTVKSCRVHFQQRFARWSVTCYVLTIFHTLFLTNCVMCSKYIHSKLFSVCRNIKIMCWTNMTVKLFPVLLMSVYKRKSHFRRHSNIDGCFQSTVAKCSVQELFTVYKNKNIFVHKSNTKQIVTVGTAGSTIIPCNWR